jgi:outer membrane biosynthesis protein TonB
MTMLHYVAFGSMLCLSMTAFAAPPYPTQAPMQAPQQAPKAAPAPMQAPMQAPKAAPAPQQAPMQAPSKMAQPMQAPTQAPLKTAQADAGYRSYSFEPDAAAYSSAGYETGNSYRAYSRRGMGRSYENVTNKTLGRVD